MINATFAKIVIHYESCVIIASFKSFLGKELHLEVTFRHVIFNQIKVFIPEFTSDAWKIKGSWSTSGYMLSKSRTLLAHHNCKFLWTCINVLRQSELYDSFSFLFHPKLRVSDHNLTNFRLIIPHWPAVTANKFVEIFNRHEGVSIFLNCASDLLSKFRGPEGRLITPITFPLPASPGIPCFYQSNSLTVLINDMCIK